MTSLSILRLIPDAARPHRLGQHRVRRRDLLTAAEARKMPEIRGRDIAMIFQEPMSSLNPVMTIGDQIGEAHQAARADVAAARAARSGDRAAAPGRHSRRRAAGSTPTRTSSPAACASG